MGEIIAYVDYFRPIASLAPEATPFGVLIALSSKNIELNVIIC